jgi:hypothetical protein
MNASALAKDRFLFAYFKEPTDTGIYYALSSGGYYWEAVNGNPIWTPEIPGELMRDILLPADRMASFRRSGHGDGARR